MIAEMSGFVKDIERLFHVHKPRDNKLSNLIILFGSSTSLLICLIMEMTNIA